MGKERLLVKRRKEIRMGKRRKTRERVLVQLGISIAVATMIAMVNGCSNKQEKKENTVTTNNNNSDVPKQTHELTLTDTNFDAETSQGVTLVDFWAPWCGPCQIQGPIIEKVAVAMAGQAKVGKCNVDETPKSAEQFGIRSIPTLIILKDGKEVERFVGVKSEAELISVLKKHIK